MIRVLRSVLDDVRGATIIEFALVSPVMLLMMMGLCDLCYRAYAQAVLTGAVQRAARDATLEGASTASIDARVQNAVKEIARNAVFTSDRTAYRSFSAVKGEPFQDDNSNGIRDAGECFSDTNSNGTWDADPGKANDQGGANDVTIYKMTVRYPRLFPLAAMLGWDANQTISAMTVLKNQPYQVSSDPATVCT